MDSLHISWRGGPGVGKRTQLLRGLERIADSRGIPFSITKKFFQVQPNRGDGAIETYATATEEEETASVASEKNMLPYEFSYVHIGFDVARMSMQDKIYLRPILQRWGVGSQVLAGKQDSASRILVFYNAHLLSTESIYLLHSLLEQCERDISIWFTSEMPVPYRLADYFLEIPVEGEDYSLKYYKEEQKVDYLPTWNDVFRKKIIHWMSIQESPKLSETNEIRAFLYECLMRNLRWVDAVHILMNTILTIPMPETKRLRAMDVLARQEATAAGQTIPSYRIPLLWENMFLFLRQSLSHRQEDGEPPSPSNGDECKVASGPPRTKVGARETNTGRRARVQKANGKEPV
jgi:hypothetical protein